MTRLTDILLAQATHTETIESVVTLIEQQVASRSGLKGMGLKTGLKMAKTVKPDILKRAVKRLLPDFAEALEPMWAKAESVQMTFAAYVRDNTDEAAAALLAVADDRIGQASPAFQSIYRRMRSSAESEVREAVPALAGLIQQRIDAH